MATVTTEWSPLSEMRMCYCSKGMSADFLCPTPSGLPPSCLRQCSRGAGRAVGTGMGFPTAKLSKRTLGFPSLPSADCVSCWLSDLHPLEELGERLWKALNSQVTLFAPSLVWRGAESKPHTEGERENLSGLPCMGRVPAGTASNPVNICLKVQCGWKSWGRRQKYMDAWRVRQVGTLPLHDVAGWDIFYVHSMVGLPCLQIPLHWAAMRSPNTLSKVRN